MTATKKKLIITIFAMIVIVTSFIYGTVAYFTDTVTSSGSYIASGEAKAEISNLTYSPSSPSLPLPDGNMLDVLPGYAYTKSVTVQNTGAYPIYVRGKTSCIITLSPENAGRESEIDYSLVIADIDTENWIFRDGYYYYKKPLLRGETTPTLLNSVSFSTDMDNMYQEGKVDFTVRLEIVQSNNNGATVFDAIGWPSEEGGKS